MICRREGRGLRLSFRKPMSRTAERDQSVVEQLEHADVGRGDRSAFDVDHEMAAALTQGVGVLAALRRHPTDLHARRKRMETLA
jgi:hypothetical protein